MGTRAFGSCRDTRGPYRAGPSRQQWAPGSIGSKGLRLTLPFAPLVRAAGVLLGTGENRDILDGIGSAGNSLARGLSDGVSGLIQNPLKGAEKDGLAGFAKGFGTGMLGLVMKPAVGVADAATDVLQGEPEALARHCIMGVPRGWIGALAWRSLSWGAGYTIGSPV